MAGRSRECSQYPASSAPPPSRFSPRRRSSRREWQVSRPSWFATEPRDRVPPSRKEQSVRDPNYIWKHPRKSHYREPASTRSAYPPSYNKYQTGSGLAYPPSHHSSSAHPQRPRHCPRPVDTGTSSSWTQRTRVREPVASHVSHSAAPIDAHHPNLHVTFHGGGFQPSKPSGGTSSLGQSPPIAMHDFQPTHAKRKKVEDDFQPTHAKRRKVEDDFQPTHAKRRKVEDDFQPTHAKRRKVEDYTDPSPSLSRRPDKWRNADTATSHSTKAVPVSKLGKKIVALDCEMVGCLEINMPRAQGAGTSTDLLRGTLNKVAMKSKRKKKRKPLLREASVAGRCSIVDYNGRVLYDEYIRPNEKILSFRTPWSGITPSDMQLAIPFDKAQAEILDLLDDCIVVGHSIVNDTDSLKMELPPPERVRDTSHYVPLRTMAGMNRASVPSLKKLANALLGLEIQKGAHDSVEDARVSMKLYKLVEQEWEGKG